MVATYYQPAFYMPNFLSSIKPSPEGGFKLMVPFGDGDKTLVPLIDPGIDTGTYVAAILAADPASVNGQHVQAVSEWATPNQTVETLSKVTGKSFKYSDLDPEVFAKILPPPVASELKENMLLIRDYSYYGKGSEKKQDEQDQKLNVGSKVSLAQWAIANASFYLVLIEIDLHQSPHFLFFPSPCQAFNLLYSILIMVA